MIGIDKEKMFIELLQENRHKIHRLCFYYLNDKNDVEDLFQEIMLNIWKNLGKFRHESKLSTWVYRIVVNTALLYNRQLKKQSKLILLASKEILGNSSDKNETDSIETEEKLLLLKRIIAGLKKQDRLIITLVLEGMTYNEISDIIGISINNVGVKINRIKKLLLKKIKEEHHG